MKTAEAHKADTEAMAVETKASEAKAAEADVNAAVGKAVGSKTAVAVAEKGTATSLGGEMLRRMLL